MKEFLPSGDFVEKTMAKIQETAASSKEPVSGRIPFVFVRITRYAAAVFGMALGIMNLARLYISVFEPIVCH